MQVEKQYLKHIQQEKLVALNLMILLLLCEEFLALGLDPEIAQLKSEVSLEERGGFLALECADAGGLFEGLLGRGVRTDYRANVLRFGPAPYLSDRQLRDSIGLLGEVAGE